MEIGAKQCDKEGTFFWISKRKKKHGPFQFKIPAASCCWSNQLQLEINASTIATMKEGEPLLISGATFWPFLTHVSFARSGPKLGPQQVRIRCLLEGPVQAHPCTFFSCAVQCRNTSTSHTYWTLCRLNPVPPWRCSFKLTRAPSSAASNICCWNLEIEPCLLCFILCFFGFAAIFITLKPRGLPWGRLFAPAATQLQEATHHDELQEH